MHSTTKATSVSPTSGRIISGPRRWWGLAGWLGLTFVAAAMGALFMPGEWYAGLAKPAWNPPNEIFGPVWTVLYGIMAVAAWLVWQRGGFAVQRRALTLFLGQLVLNAAWTPLFFGLHLLGIAFAEILLLLVLIGLTMRAFFRVNLPAGWLMVPYFLWVGFATVLNFTLWRLNS